MLYVNFMSIKLEKIKLREDLAKQTKSASQNCYKIRLKWVNTYEVLSITLLTHQELAIVTTLV